MILAHLRARTVGLAAALAATAELCAARPAFAVPRERPVQAAEKSARTPAQKKVDSQLLYEIYRKRGQAREKQVPPGPTIVRIDSSGRALVDIRGDVTPALVALVKTRGGVVLSTSVEYRSIIARVPLLEIERLASYTAVRAISPAPEATTNR